MYSQKQTNKTTRKENPSNGHKSYTNGFSGKPCLLSQKHLLEAIADCGCPMLGPGFIETGTMPAAFGSMFCFWSLVLRFSSSSFWIL